MIFKIEIRGICPLLMHKFSEDDLIKPSKRTKDKQLSESEKIDLAKQFLYTDSRGKLVQPSSHIEGTMIKAASQFTFKGKKTYKELVKGGVFAFPELIPHKIPKWVVDARAIVNPNTRGRSMCYRPRLDDWKLAFTLEVNDARADKNVIRQILEHAGAYIGIGNYRPRFGRFEVTKFE